LEKPAQPLERLFSLLWTGADVLVIMVTNSDQAEAVLFGEAGAVAGKQPWCQLLISGILYQLILDGSSRKVKELYVVAGRNYQSMVPLYESLRWLSRSRLADGSTLIRPLLGVSPSTAEQLKETFDL
jgi:hypothetical protein